MTFLRELILIASSIQLSTNINMESLHIATVLSRDKEDYQREQDWRAQAITVTQQTQTSASLAPFVAFGSMSIDQLTLLFSGDSWLRHMSSFCTCRYFQKQIMCDKNALCQSIFCSCLAKYSPLDPDGTMRLKLVSYLLRIQSALNTTQRNHFTVRELM